MGPPEALRLTGEGLEPGGLELTVSVAELRSKDKDRLLTGRPGARLGNAALIPEDLLLRCDR